MLTSLVDANSNGLPSLRVSRKLVVNNIGYRESENLSYQVAKALEENGLPTKLNRASRKVEYTDLANNTKGIVVFSQKTGGWKDLLRGIKYTEIIFPQGKEWVDNEGREMLSYAFERDIPEEESCRLKVLCLNGGFYDLLSEQEKGLSWGRFKLGDFRKGMLDYFEDPRNPMEEEYRLAILGTGGTYRPST